MDFKNIRAVNRRCHFIFDNHVNLRGSTRTKRQDNTPLNFKTSAFTVNSLLAFFRNEKAASIRPLHFIADITLTIQLTLSTNTLPSTFPQTRTQTTCFDDQLDDHFHPPLCSERR